VLIATCVGGAILLVGVGVAGAVGSFWAVLVLAAGWALVGAVGMPVQGADLNGMISSQQRATVLGFVSLMGSGGVSSSSRRSAGSRTCPATRPPSSPAG
jgi:hypothetical protein